MHTKNTQRFQTLRSAHRQAQFRTSQRGAALVIGLVLLTVLTVLTASSMTSSTLSLRMADNVKQQDVAFQAAESALMQALTSPTPFTLDGTVLLDQFVREDMVFSYTGNGAGSAETVVRTVLRDRLSADFGCEENGAVFSSGCTHQHFRMEAETSSGRGGTDEQAMGFYIRVPN